MTIADHVSRLPRRMQRTLAVLFVPAALLLIGTSLLWPALHAYRAQIEWRAIVVDTLARQRGLAAIEAEVRKQLTALPGLDSWQRLYLGMQGSGAIALQSDISNALSAAHARPQTFTPIAPTRAGPLSKVGLRVAAAMTIDQLREFLLRIQALKHFVRIEHLVIVAPPLQSVHENPTLTVTLDAFGFGTDDAAVNAALSAQTGKQ